jgi:CTP synthase
MPEAHSYEFDKGSPDPVICMMDDQLKITDKGGTMRLGAYPAHLAEGSRVAEIYGVREISERHRHRYEVNNDYRDVLAEKGLVFSGTSPDAGLVEMIELPDHPYFVGCQFHPEFKSRPNRPHPLFASFVEAAAKHAGLIEGGEPEAETGD